MNEKKKLQPIGEVLRSPRFQKEISLLLFFFSAVQLIFSVFLFGGGASPDDLFTAVTSLMATIVYVVLGILIRYGSLSALIFTAILFTADTLIALFGPSWEAARGMLIARGLLIWVLVGFIRRERRANTSDIR